MQWWIKDAASVLISDRLPSFIHCQTGRSRETYSLHVGENNMVFLCVGAAEDVGCNCACVLNKCVLVFSCSWIRFANLTVDRENKQKCVCVCVFFHWSPRFDVQKKNSRQTGREKYRNIWKEASQICIDSWCVHTVRWTATHPTCTHIYQCWVSALLPPTVQ